MKTSLSLLAFLLVFSVATQAQEGQKEVIIVQKEAPRNFTTIRVGLWFPKDGEKKLTFADAESQSAQNTASQAQAWGGELHFRNNIGSPLSLDFSAGGWYSTDVFEYMARPLEAAISFQQKTTSWALIIPLTAGLSIAPLPETNPLQPYAMAGVGAYIATGGIKTWYPTQSTQTEKTKIVFGGYVGAGLDFLFAKSFGASLGLKYHFVKFNEPLSTFQQDFTGLQIQLGIATAF